MQAGGFQRQRPNRHEVATVPNAPGRALREIVALYWESGVGDDVPALAWFLLSSLVPLALGLTALATVLLGDYAQAQALAARASRVLPEDLHDQLVQLILRTKRDSPLLIAGSIVSMLWITSGAVGVLHRCLTRLLGVPGAGIVRGRLRNLADRRGPDDADRADGARGVGRHGDRAPPPGQLAAAAGGRAAPLDRDHRAHLRCRLPLASGRQRAAGAPP